MIAKSLDSWVRCDFTPLFDDSRALWKHLRKTVSRKPADPSSNIDKHLDNSKASGTLRRFSKQSKVFWFTRNDKFMGETVLSVLQDKQLSSRAPPEDNGLPNLRSGSGQTMELSIVYGAKVLILFQNLQTYWSTLWKTHGSPDHH